MRTLLITLCFNEMDILPFVKQYWERLDCDVLVYDNGSTDGSIEFLQKLPYVTLRHFDTSGMNDIIHKQIKEQAYLEFKDKYDIIIVSDMDELFYFNDFKALGEAFVASEYTSMVVPIISLCEASKPPYLEDKLLHQQCHMFYKQKMNQMKGFEDYSKVSIFNARLVSNIHMSVGQHFAQTEPYMKVLKSSLGFCLHIDKGFGEDYYVSKHKKMGENLSETNKQYGMGIHYLFSEQQMREEYKTHQNRGFDINV